MLKFPDESVKKAKEIADRYKARSQKKLEWAASLYDNDFLEIGYGFSESIRRGNCGRYLHEIDKETDCFTMAGALYLVAREANLDPQLYFARDMRDVNGGENSSDKLIADHGFITTEVANNKTQMVDPHMNQWGSVRFAPDDHKIFIYNKRKHETTERTYSSLENLSEQDFLSRIEKQRTPEGGRIVLEATQKVSAADYRDVFVSYLSDSKEIMSSHRLKHVLIHPEEYQKTFIYEMKTKVSDNGNFDFNNGELKIYEVSGTGWSKHENPQTPFIVPVNIAQNLWRIWDKVLSNNINPMSVHGMNTYKIFDLLHDSGFRSDFSIESQSLASKVVSDNELASTYEQTKFTLEKSLETFMRNVKDDEISYKVLIRDTHFVMSRDEVRSSENPLGLLYTDQERTDFIEELHKDWSEHLQNQCDDAIKTMRVHLGLAEGASHLAMQRFYADNKRRERKYKYADEASNVNRYTYKTSIPRTLDRSIFFSKYDLPNTTCLELKSGLDDINLRRAAQERIYTFLMEGYKFKRALFLKKFQPGLKKILDKT